jgi:hypothetical protein
MKAEADEEKRLIKEEEEQRRLEALYVDIPSPRLLMSIS